MRVKFDEAYKQKYVSKTVKEKRIFEGKSAAANLAAYSVSIDTCITNTK